MAKNVNLTLTPMKQLIDLNGDKVNFEVQFKVESKDNLPFQAVVITQAILDNNMQIEYQNANGSISGNIVADDNTYNNYLLLLKADKPTEVVVTSQIREIPPNQQVQQQIQQQQMQEQQKQMQQQQMQEEQFVSQKLKKKGKKDWNNILLIGFMIVLGLIALWLLYPCISSYFSNLFSKPDITETITNSLENTKKEISSEINNINQKLDGKLELLENTLPTKINENVEGIVSQVVEKKIADNLEGVVSQVVEKKMEEVKIPTVDLSSIQSAISEVKEKVDGITSSTIQNPLKIAGKRESLAKSLQNLKITS